MLLDRSTETKEERKVRIDRMLEQYSNPKICISCREPIYPEQSLLTTIHGDYHDAPKLCVEGRPD